MSITPKYLVTGATGTTASYVIPMLLAKGVQVRAFVHKLDERAEKLTQLGAEVVQGDLLDFHSVSRAVAGITGIYFVYPILTPGILTGTAYVMQAAREAGVASIVNMSQISARRDSQSHAAQDHWLAERLLDLSGLKVTHIRPTFFAEWLVYGNTIRQQNKIILPFGEGRYAPIAAEDQGRVITELLTNPVGHEGKTYPLFGPVEYNEYEVAEVLTEVLGRRITYEAISIETYQQVAAEAGYPAHFIQHISAVAQDCRDGLFAGTNDAVAQITGRQPLGIQEFIAKNRMRFE